METAQDRDTALVNGIQQSLNQAGQATSPSDIIPQNHQTPMPKTKELEDVGAEITGEDIAYNVGTTLGELTGGVSKSRTAPASEWLRSLLRKLHLKKQPNEEIVWK